MSRNRFEMILSFLHFANNDNYIERDQAGFDRLFKICPIIDLVIPQVSAGLLEGYSRKGRKKSSGEMPQRLTERHFLYKADDHPDCVVCSNRTRPKGRRQTKYRCRQCGVGLCVVPCNERYHTIKNYKQCHLDG